MKKLPVSQQVYTFREVLELDLRDLPCLLLIINDNEAVVQTSHIICTDLLKNEKWANSQWRYIRETYEWIPIFKFCENIHYSELVDVEPCNTSFIEENELWVTPKGFPREQYVRSN